MNGMHMEGHLGKRHRQDDMGSHADSLGHGPPRKRKDFEPMPPNHILLFTIQNPVYPITTDILHTICSAHARVLRIVIFQKNGVQAMIELESIEAACAVREQLAGADIYSGCCTLKIEFAKPDRLNVTRNDARSWDYTMPGPGKEPEPIVKKAPLLPEPPAGFPMSGGGGGYGGESRHGGPPADRYGGSPRGAAAPLVDRYGGGPERGAYGGDRGFADRGDRYGSDRGFGGGADYGGGRDYGASRDPDYGRGAVGGYGRDRDRMDYDQQRPMEGARGRRDEGMRGGTMSTGAPQQGAVLMVYDMNKDRMNPDRLFNIFCQYGNVVRVKFLKSKEGCAMIQMEDNLAVERCLNNLNSLEFFNARMQLSYSKQPYLNEVQSPHVLGDNTSSYADFSRNRNNRFLDPSKASKNRIQGPSSILHFYNMPPGMSNDEINEIFTSKDVAAPENIKLFPARSERSCSGLFEFASQSDAIEALAVINHVSVPHSSSKFPYTLKLCFSSTRESRGGGGPPEGGRRDGPRGGGDRHGGDGGDFY